jgi:hypothetical protein
VVNSPIMGPAWFPLFESSPPESLPEARIITVLTVLPGVLAHLQVNGAVANLQGKDFRYRVIGLRLERYLQQT